MNNIDRISHYGNRILCDGVVVSNDPFAERLNGNDLIIGGSGSGKTTGYVGPNLECAVGSMVVADTKGQLARKYSDTLRAHGFDVRVLDFVRPECGNVSYNPLAYIRRYPDGSPREQDLMTVAAMLQGRLDTREPFWDHSSASYLAFLLGYVLMELPPAEQTLCSVAKLHQAFLSSSNSLDFVKWAKAHANTFAARKYMEVMAGKAADRTFSCIMTFASTALDRYTFREASGFFDNRTPFDLAEIGRKKTCFFLNLSDTDFTYTRIATLFYNQLLNVLVAEADSREDGCLQIPVRIILDDFCSSSAGLPDFDKLISVTRSRDISVSIILQSISQLYSQYGRDSAHTIMDNCDHTLFLGGSSMETAEYLSLRAGRTPESLLLLPNDKVYLFTRGQKASVHDKLLPVQSGTMVAKALTGVDLAVNAPPQAPASAPIFDDWEDDLPFT